MCAPVHIACTVLLLAPLLGAGQEPCGIKGPGAAYTQGKADGEISAIGVPADAIPLGVEPLGNNVEWLREEVDPIRRARRQIHRLMYERADERAQETVAADAARHSIPQDPSIEWADWRFSVGNNGNWSPYPDRELDARNIRFPLRMKTDNRSEAEKALEQMRQEGRH